MWPTPQLDVGVIYTHERQWMRPLLESLAGSCGSVAVRLLLVDNASVDGAAQWEPLFPWTRLLHNPQRLGYAANLNRILAASTAPLVLLLNTDMYFDPHNAALERLVRFMHGAPRCGVCTCRIYHPDGTYAYPARRFQNLRVVAARRFGLHRWLRRSIDHYLYAEHSPHDTFACDWVSGCLMLVRRAAYEQIGPFDERFRKYFEDVDYCLRMWRGGWEVAFHGDAYAYHAEQRASRRLWSRDAWLHARSYARWIRKWGLHPGRSGRRRAA
jgi:GT2 family glycosyltransferase